MHAKLSVQKKSYSKGTMESHILTRAHETSTILSKVVSSEDMTKSMGCVQLSIEYMYFLRTFPITRSTCIRTLAMFLVCSTATGSNCFLPFVKAGSSRREQ